MEKIQILEQRGDNVRIYTADKACIGCLKLSVFVIASGAAGAVILLMGYGFLSLLLIAFVIVTALLVIFFYMPRYLTAFTVFIDSGIIVKHSGVFLRSRRSLEIHAVSGITLVSMPFSNYTGFRCVILNYHGGRMLLPFLGKEAAEEITAVCLNRGNDYAS